jgi:hypothetical protein
MIAPRQIPAVLAIAVLPACVSSSFETPDTLGALNVTSVEVAVTDGSTGGGASVISGRSSVVSPAQFVADLDANLTAALRAASDPSGTPATVRVAVSEVYLAPPLERVVAGTSYIAGTVSVTGTDGRVLIAPTLVRGNTSNIRLAGTFGLLTTPSLDNDYRGTLRGFVGTVRDALFGSPDA